MKGFTFVEVLIAMAIFTMTVIAAIDIAHGSVRATRDARETSAATWLLQQKMVELETKLETEGFEKACEDKKDGKFEDPYKEYTWLATCEEIDFQMSESAAQIAGDVKGDDEKGEKSTEDQLLKILFQSASDYMGKASRELHVEVHWKSGKNQRVIDVTTHVVRYDKPFVIGQ